MPMDYSLARLANRRLRRRTWLRGLHVDIPLLVGLLLLAVVGLTVLYSASAQSMDVLIRQLIRLALGFGVMLVLAHISPHHLERWTPWLYGLGVALLLAVAVTGEVGKGAQRWLALGAVRILAAPTLRIAEQPDLGTARRVASSGTFVLLLAGVSWRLVGLGAGLLAAIAPVLWYFLHDYQRQRVITFLNPETDPLGTGYHIIQSKIAIGSGGIYGKGWLNGTQAHLDFLPERSTDFIFAVLGEELGLIGILLLLTLYLFIIGRGLYIASEAQTSYTRLVAGSITLTFFVYVFVNIGMVTGLLPVGGVPLPLVSYGGTSLVTIMAAFGILMSIHTHRRLLPS